MAVAAGDTFLNEEAPGTPQHLWIVVTDPAGTPPSVVIVSVSTHARDRPRIDDTCLLEAGDHPFIRHTSFVFYAKARMVKTADVDQLKSKTKLIPHAHMSPRVLSRVQEGFLQSPFAEGRFAKLVEAQLNAS